MEKINIANHQSILRLRVRYIINGQSLAVQIEKSVVVSPAYGVKHRVIEGGKTVNMSIVRLANINDGGHVVSIPSQVPRPSNPRGTRGTELRSFQPMSCSPGVISPGPRVVSPGV